MEFLITQASSYAADIDQLILIVAILSGFWLLLAEGALFYFTFRYRRSRNPKAAYVTGEKHEEMKWIHWPHNLIILCDIVILVFAISAWYKIKQDLPKEDYTIGITGQQWAWRFTHPGANGELTANDTVELVDELHVVVDKVYHFKLESDDVLHSFSVPVFRLKQDAIPGRIITGWFKPTKEGVYDIQCAEMCGVGHGIMGARLYVQSDADYQSWISQKRSQKLSK